MEGQRTLLELYVTMVSLVLAAVIN